VGVLGGGGLKGLLSRLRGVPVPEGVRGSLGSPLGSAP
jgi:hypothetical protein